MTSPATPGVPETAERLRHAVIMLARLLRHQDDGGLGATATAALGSVKVVGPLTLGELAAREQVAPPTMTKVVEKLEAQGFVTRQADINDRRVSRVSITPAGRRFLDVTRLRRTAWLAERLDQMPAEQLAKVADALRGLEMLISSDTSDTSDTSGASDASGGPSRR